MTYIIKKVPALNERKGERITRGKVPLTKEQRKREAEEHAQELRKERLRREIELGALNTKRYRTLWREMMMRTKMPQIVEDVEIAWRNFDRALDIKDYRSTINIKFIYRCRQAN